MVEVDPARARRELVRESSPGATISKTPSMVVGWIPWKWIVCGCEPRVDESDAEEVVLGRADHGAGDRAVVRPGGEEDAGGDLELSSRATSVYSRTRPGLCGSAGGG